jgi:hypothetical protein
VRQQDIAEITPTKVTQGETYVDNEGKMYDAAKAVDRNLSTQSRAVVPWFELEFGKAYHVQMIRIYFTFYTNWYDPQYWCAQSVENFKECVDGHNNVDVSVYKGDVKQKSCGKLQLTYGLKQSDQIYTLICNTEGDTVKLSKDTGSIAVFEMLATKKGG